jgi:hypothetical protein
VFLHTAQTCLCIIFFIEVTDRPLKESAINLFKSFIQKGNINQGGLTEITAHEGDHERVQTY